MTETLAVTFDPPPEARAAMVAALDGAAQALTQSG